MFLTKEFADKTVPELSANLANYRAFAYNKKLEADMVRIDEEKVTMMTVKPRYLTIRNAALYTSIPESVLYERKREIGHCKVGKSIRFMIDDLDAYMLKHHVEPKDGAYNPSDTAEQILSKITCGNGYNDTRRRSTADSQPRKGGVENVQTKGQ